MFWGTVMADDSAKNGAKSTEELHALLAAAEAERDRALTILAAKDRVIQAQKEVIELTQQGNAVEQTDLQKTAGRTAAAKATVDAKGAVNQAAPGPRAASADNSRTKSSSEVTEAASGEPRESIEQLHHASTTPTRSSTEQPSHVVITSTVFELITNPIVFFILYLLFVVPTYILPYFGSNSLVVNGAVAASGGSNPFFWIHVLCFACLIVITWWRGYVADSGWIAIFPVFAGIFDLVPGFTWFFLLPTLMHVLAVVFGVKQKAADDEVIRAGFAVRLLIGIVVIAVAVFAVGTSITIANSSGSSRLTRLLPGRVPAVGSAAEWGCLATASPPGEPGEPAVLSYDDKTQYSASSQALAVCEQTKLPNVTRSCRIIACADGISTLNDAQNLAEAHGFGAILKNSRTIDPSRQ